MTLALIGHAEVERTLRDAATGGRLHHAWLFHGPEGIGKATVARRFARALLAGFPGTGLDVPPEHPAGRLVERGSHPDLLTIARGFDERRKRLRSEIVVDDVRGASAFLALTPAEDGWRVVLVDGADHLNRNAANAILKLLEEPPRRAIVLLTARSVASLLPTIRSRCRRVALQPLADAEVDAILRREAPELATPERARLVALAEGSPGRALAWAAQGLARLAVSIAERQQHLPPDVSSAAAPHAVADAHGRDNEATLAALAVLRADALDRIRNGARGGASAAVLARASEAWSQLGAIAHDLDRFNLDRRQAILDAFRTLAAT